MNSDPLARLYLRASTKDQDATRAQSSLETFAREQGLRIASRYIENESGAKLERPELFRLLEDSNEGDIILIEQVDRLSRLKSEDWQSLKEKIRNKRLRVISLDLPSSSILASTDAFTASMLDAINNMMLDMLAAIARKDYEDRRRRQNQGIAKAKADGRYKGRPDDEMLQSNISTMLSKGMSYSEIQKVLGASRATIAKVSRKKKALEE